MKYKICWEKDGSSDSMIIEGETIEELQKVARKEIDKRKPDNYWSEEL